MANVIPSLFSPLHMYKPKSAMSISWMLNDHFSESLSLCLWWPVPTLITSDHTDSKCKLNVNLYFSKESSRKSHAIELILYMWHYARWCHWKCYVATYSSKLQPSIICMPQLQPWCLAALVTKFTTLKSGMKAQVSCETTIEPHELVHYFALEPACHR